MTAISRRLSLCSRPTSAARSSVPESYDEIAGIRSHSQCAHTCGCGGVHRLAPWRGCVRRGAARGRIGDVLSSVGNEHETPTRAFCVDQSSDSSRAMIASVSG
jgi:hypothetical protein